MSKKLLLSFCVASNLFAQYDDHYKSGAARIAHIMSNEETDVGVSAKKNIKYAETQNLVHDLNTTEIAHFFDCKTVWGTIYLQETLNNPIRLEDLPAVLQRQNAIKTLVENPAIKKEVDQLLEMVKQSENDIILLFSDYFKGQNCPELANLEIIKKQNPYLYPFFKFITHNPKAKCAATALSLISIPIGTATTAYLAKISYDLARAGYHSINMYLLTAYCGLLDGISMYGAYKDYSLGSEKRKKLHALNQLITSAELIEKLCSQFGIEQHYKISDYKDIVGYQLIKELKHDRYARKQCALFLTSSVHTFIYKLYEHDKQLAQLFATIGEMDAYNALANKILASKEQGNKFCFAHFNENKNAFIQATNFWNVLVTNPIVNSISEDRNIILTGPNKGGKTTAIRALLQNIVMAQSFGIAAAEYFESSVFDVIHSYLNVSDDLINGLSLFASELKRAQEILHRIKSLNNNEKFFFALDELFTGTVAEDGEQCAHEFIKKIGNYDGIQFIYATHFNKLKELAEHNARCVNYRVDAPFKNEEGKLMYPFTLSKGYSDSRVALDLAREAQLFD